MVSIHAITAAITSSTGTATAIALIPPTTGETVGLVIVLEEVLDTV